MTQQIVPEVLRQLQEAYTTTQVQLERDPNQATPVWQEAVSQISGIDLSNITPEEFVKAHSCLSFMQQCLVATATRQSNFNG